MVRGIVLLALLSGCYNFPPLHKTAQGIEIHIDADVTVSAEEVDRWVDLRLKEWLAHKADWGCAKWSDRELLDAAQSEPIIIRGGTFIAGTRVMGVNYYDELGQERIVVTINYPPLRPSAGEWDPEYVKKITLLPGDNGNGNAAASRFDFEYSYGLRQLPHEWTHTVRKAWHP